jgi:hypothetical protein
MDGFVEGVKKYDEDKGANVQSSAGTRHAEGLVHG